MRPALVLVDLQEDFLAEPGLEPHRDSIVAAAAELLGRARQSGAAVVHVRTTVTLDPDTRMPHWRAADRRLCIEGSPGHALPEAVRPAPGETVIDKTGFGAGPTLAQALSGCDAALVAGVHLHACVRQAALDLHAAGVTVYLARDAVGSHEPAHAAQTEAYLAQRLIASLPQSAAFKMLEREPPRLPRPQLHVVSRVPAAGLEKRIQVLVKAADLVAEQKELISRTITGEIGKPIRYARAEAARVAALFRAVAARASGQHLQGRESEAVVRRRSLGTVAVITPWNNPAAIAAGQLAPAWVYGNAVAWKPAPAGCQTAALLHRLMMESGVEPESLQLIEGGAETALALIRQLPVDGVCFTGATSSGRVVAALCAERNLPLQAELGGNNAAVVTPTADLPQAAALIAEAAFGCAGQRCTATRRVIVPAELYDDFLPMLEQAVVRMPWGDPWREEILVGPLLTAEHAERIGSLVERARAAGHRIRQPHISSGASAPGPTYFPPTIVLCDDPAAEIVQEETFGPVLVVQRYSGFAEALELLNGVRQGLAAALFSTSDGERHAFLECAQAGILKLNQATIEAGVDVPFGGWKASGMGPPQHGSANLEFFTRAQTLYGAASAPRA